MGGGGAKLWVAMLRFQRGCTVRYCISLFIECTLHELHAVEQGLTFNLLVFFSLCRINEKHGIWCFISTICLFSEAAVCKQLHNHFCLSLNLIEIIQYQVSSLLCQFKRRLFIVIFRAYEVGVHSVSYWRVYGELVLQLATRQMLHCQIPLFKRTQAFLSFGLGVECQPCAQWSYLSPRCSAHPRGNYLGGIPTHPFTSSTTWLNDVWYVYPFIPLKSGILSICYKIICVCKTRRQTPGGKFIAGRSSGNDHAETRCWFWIGNMRW